MIEFTHQVSKSPNSDYGVALRADVRLGSRLPKHVFPDVNFGLKLVKYGFPRIDCTKKLLCQCQHLNSYVRLSEAKTVPETTNSRFGFKRFRDDNLVYRAIFREQNEMFLT